MDKILRSTGGTVSIQLYDANGDPADAGSGNGSAAIADSAGAAIAGSPFTPAHTPGTGLYTVTIPNTLATLDRYLVTWTFPDASVRRTYFEVVGGFLFTQAAIRTFDAELADQTTYPDALLVDVREIVEERFEEVSGRSWVLRGRRVILDGWGRSKLLIPDFDVVTLISAEIDGTALDAGQLADVKPSRTTRSLTWTTGIWTAGFANVELFYTYGVEAPAPIVLAAKKYAKYLLLKSALEASERATAVFTEMGGYRLTTAGRDGKLGLPEVDEVLIEFGRRSPGFV